MLVQRNLARTTQPARPVLQTEITSVCVFSDLLAMTVKTVLIHSIVISQCGVTQLSGENFKSLLNIARIVVVVAITLGSTPSKNWLGGCGPLPKTLTLFMIEICEHYL